MKFKSIICLGIFTCLALAGCKTNSNKKHVHNYDTNNIEWQWTELSTGGYKAKAILSCDSCEESVEGHTLELDAKVTSEQTKVPTCVAPGTMTYTASIDYEGSSYSSKKERSITDQNAHHYVEVQADAYLKTAATCTEDAVYYKSCEHCHEFSTETFVAANTKLGHHMIHHAATTSTCQVHGHIEYYECDRCHKLFLEQSGTTEVTEDDVTLPLSHHYVEVQADAYLKSPATCTEDAVYYKSCEYCHEKATETFTIANSKLGHHLTHHDASSSTCQVHGNIEYYDCDRCNKYFSDAEATAELSWDEIELPYAHDMTYHAGTDATCTEDGSHGYYTCSYEPGVMYKDEEGNEKFNDASELVISKLGHTFDDSLNCVRGDTTLKDEYGMEDATALDLIDPVTISDLGIEDGVEIPRDGGHIFVNYEYPANKGIDLWFRFNYTVSSGDGYFYFYFFNQYDEAGMVCRLQTNRTEDDGRIRAYIFTQNDYSSNPGTTAVHGAGNVGTNFWFPYPCGVKSSTANIAHFTAYCLDETTNLYRCTYTIGVEGGTQYYPVPTASDVPGSKGDNETTNPEFHFDICLGENYFDGGLHKKFRITCSPASNPVTLHDHSSEQSALIYKNAAGNVVGKLSNPGTARIPTLVGENKTFLGWFNTKGNKVEDGDDVSGKVIITPRFVANQTNMFVPSDTTGNRFADAKGGWFESSSFAGECGDQLPVSEISDRYDLYYIYHFVSKSNDDNYAIFGAPFDMIDEKTRIFLRIDNKENGSLTGYIYGGATNLGDAGAAGTMFTQAGFRTNGSDLLIHLAVYNTSAAGLTFSVEIVNLGNGEVYQTSRDVTFKDATLYSLNDPTRNMFDCMKHACEYRITDAF